MRFMNNVKRKRMAAEKLELPHNMFRAPDGVIIVKRRKAIGNLKKKKNKNLEQMISQTIRLQSRESIFYSYLRKAAVF